MEKTMTPAEEAEAAFDSARRRAASTAPIAEVELEKRAGGRLEAWAASIVREHQLSVAMDERST